MSFIELATVIQEDLRRLGSWASPSVSYILVLPTRFVPASPAVPPHCLPLFAMMHTLPRAANRFMLNIDLHCHSTASDGLLTPAQLLEHAAERGVDVLALTDHDEVSGLDEARRTAAEHGIALINGVEISVTWRGQTVHIVGLGIDPGHPQLVKGLMSIRDGRMMRARNIAAQLDKFGIHGSFEGSSRNAGDGHLIGPLPFAPFPVRQRNAQELKRVFRA